MAIRQDILKAICKDPLSATEISEETGIEYKTVANNMFALVKEGLAERRHDEDKVIYAITKKGKARIEESSPDPLPDIPGPKPVEHTPKVTAIRQESIDPHISIATMLARIQSHVPSGVELVIDASQIVLIDSSENEYTILPAEFVRFIDALAMLKERARK